MSNSSRSPERQKSGIITRRRMLTGLAAASLALAGVGMYPTRYQEPDLPQPEGQESLERRNFREFQKFLETYIDPGTNAKLFQTLKERSNDPNLRNYFKVEGHESSDEDLAAIEGDPDNQPGGAKLIYKSTTYMYKFSDEEDDNFQGFDIAVTLSKDVRGRDMMESITFYIDEEGEIRNSTNTPSRSVNYQPEVLKSAVERTLKEKNVDWNKTANHFNEPLNGNLRSEKSIDNGMLGYFADKSGRIEIVRFTP